MSNPIINKLLKGGIGVLPTDTIYGIVGRAFSRKAVERIYKLKRRNPKKPFIVLIASLGDLKSFGLKIDEKTRKILKKYWFANDSSDKEIGNSGKISVVLPGLSKKFQYLHRGTKTIAFRRPNKKELLKILEKTGPLVAPSANPEGRDPASTTKEAKKYFGNRIDFYVDGGKRRNFPSALIKIENGEIVILRKGAIKLY